MKAKKIILTMALAIILVSVTASALAVESTVLSKEHIKVRLEAEAERQGMTYDEYLTLLEVDAEEAGLTLEEYLFQMHHEIGEKLSKEEIETIAELV